MNTKLYVGNLSFNTTEGDLQNLFSQYGGVANINMITDRATGRSRGFAFVTMDTPEGARTALAALNGQNLDGRDLTVNEARPREEGAGARSGGGGGSYSQREGGGRREKEQRR